MKNLKTQRLKNLAFTKFVALGVTALVLLVLAVILSFFGNSLLELLKLMLALIVYLFLPGYSLLLNLRLSDLERLVFSVPLSAALISVTIYLLNVILFVPINFLSVVIVILIYTLIGLFFPEIQSFINKIIASKHTGE